MSLKSNQFNLQKVMWEIISLPKIFMIKLRYGKRAKLTWIEHFEKATRFTFMGKNSTMCIGRACHIKRGTEILTSDYGKIKLGAHVCINSNCYIASQYSLEIGDGCEIGPNVVIVDHDHDFRRLGGIREGKYKCSPIKIGKNVWIGANTVILKGTVLGDNCVVGAGGVISGVYTDNSVIVQNRNEKTYMYKMGESYD